MEMVKKQTAFYVSIIQWVGGVFFGSSFVGAFITGLVVSVVLNMVATKVNFTDGNTESDKDDEGEEK